MSKINQYSAAKKLAILQEFWKGQKRHIDVAEKYDISVTTLVKWRHRHEFMGMMDYRFKPGTKAILLSLNFKPFKIIFQEDIHSMKSLISII